MSDFRIYSHEIISEFIDCFRNHPSLWQIKSHEYKDTIKKMRGYSELLEIVRKVERNATIDSVKKKINSLRAGYRKEKKKVHDSKRTGSGADQIYVPKLWYYPLLEFLSDNNNNDMESLDNLNVEDTEIEYSSSNNNLSTIEDDSNAEINNNVSSPPSTSTTSNNTSTSTLRRKRHANDEIAKTIALIGKKLDKNDDEFDAIGKNVAAKLRNMTHYQQGIAEKLINEVIFLGRFEKLNLNTTVNIGPTQESQNVQMQTKCMPMHPISNSCVPATRNAQIISIPESDTFAPATQDSQVISIPESLVPYLNFT